MTMWSVGDVGIAKEDKEHCCPIPGCVGEIFRGRAYRVKAVVPSEGEFPMGLVMEGLETLIYGIQQGEIVWPHYFFEKLVSSDQDIFKMADAPKVTEDA